MMKRTIPYKYLLTALMCTVLLQACHKNDEPLMTQEDDGVRLSIEVVIPAGTQTTRAPQHDIVAGTSAESFIDIDANDYCIMLFKNDRLWQFFTPDTFVMQSADATSDIDRKYLLSGIVHGVTSDEEEVQVVVLANWKGFNSSANYDFWIGQDLESDLYLNQTDYNFTLPDTTTAWYPEFSTTTHRTIPMFGSADVTLFKTSDNANSTLSGNSIPMLRSVAKIEVVDATQTSNKVKITNVSLTTFNTKGRFIPDVSSDSENAAWSNLYNGGIHNQVYEPSLPDNVALDTTRTLTFFSDNDHKRFAAYVPEMEITDDAIPAIAVTVQSTEDQEDTKTFIIKLQDEDLNINIEELLRNHIYRITIETVSTPMVKNNLTLTVDVVPYKEVWLDPEFGLPDSDEEDPDPDDDDDDDDGNGDVGVDP